MRRRVAFAVALVVVWVAAPVLLVVGSLLALEHEESVIQKPTWVTPTAVDGSVDSQIGLLLDWSESAAILAPDWNGTTQKVSVGPGVAVDTGTEVAVIDGVTRIAAVTDTPFFRSLTRGDRGSDVAALNDLLGRLGHQHDSEDVFAGTTERGVEQLAARLNVVPDHPVRFDPAWIVFLPSPAVVASSEWRPGQVAPSQGEVLAQLRPELEGVTFTDTETAEAARENENFDGTAGADGAPVTFDAITGLVVAGQNVDIDLDGESADVTAEGRESIEAVAEPGARALLATVSLGFEGEGWSIPLAAVISGEDGRCVIVREGDGRESPVDVAVVGYSGDAVVVKGDLARRGDVAVPGGAAGASCG